jgi:hypothetical protein
LQAHLIQHLHEGTATNGRIHVAERPVHIVAGHFLAPSLEIIMNSSQFARPVSIFIGLGFARDIECVKEAFELLNDWPSGGRGPLHEAAIEACHAALDYECDDETVRQAFEAFARDSGILVTRH